MDAGTIYTDKKTKKLENKLNEVYSEAQKDIQKKMNTFTQKYKQKLAIHEQELKDGKITQAQFDAWVEGQIFQGKQWKAKQQQILASMYNANSIAAGMINGDAQSVFAANANFMSYTLEHTAGVNFGFGLYDGNTVAKLIKDDPKLLPEWKINEPKDYVWNQKKLNNALTQGIIQGESLDQIAKRVASGLAMQNYNASLTFARTAMTGAQNSGRDTSLINAKAKGINVVKQWMSTLDGRTRDSHRHMDGETIKVKDKWHPAVFSNGCRFPGDPDGPPQEVYNCRCTMVGELVDYPAEYQRYDNIDGKPIKSMTYEEWYKAKYGTELFKVKAPAKAAKSMAIDWSKYGNKEVAELAKKYNYDWDKFVDESTGAEFNTVWEVDNYTTENAIKWFDNAKQDEALLQKANKPKKAPKKAVKELTEEEKLKKQYDEAKAKLDVLEQEIKDKGADKTFKGIWKDDVTYADWETKKNSIVEKQKYYNSQIKKHQGNIDAGLPHPEVYQKFIDEAKEHLDELAEFEKHGEEYSKLLAERKTAKQTAQALKPKPTVTSTFDPAAYSQERKDKAVWAKSPREADDALRSKTGEVWRAATEGQKDAIYEYTSSYSKFNEPLRGWEYGQSNYATGSGFKGVGNTDLNAGRAHNGVMLNDMTDIIDQCYYDEDIWLQRGCNYGGMDKFFGVDMNLLEYGTQEELEAALIGTTPTEFGFMSCGSSKGRGFHKSIMLNIYAPSGTKMMYVEPFSAFGNGFDRAWDGIKAQSGFGSELETILQQGTQFRVVKVERSGGTLYFDLEVINQSNLQRWIP